MIRIYRRKFNVEKGKPNPKQLVATFQNGMGNEATSTLALLQAESTSFDVNLLSDWRYMVEVDPEPIAKVSEGKDVQVDTSKAQFTKRPISYQLSWEIKTDGTCHCLAFNQRYGVVRGIVEDSPKGRTLFRNRVTSVWPNADISTK